MLFSRRHSVVPAVLAVLSFATPGMAQDSTEEPTSKAAEPTAATPTQRDTSMGESAAARSGRVAGANLESGFTVGAIPGSGFDAYWQPMPSLQVGLLYNSGKLDLKSALEDSGSDVELTKAEISASITSLLARYFLGNSFYANVGLGQRHVEAAFGMKSKLVDVGVEGEITATTPILLLGIGNQWQWDSGFTLGVEWLGYAAALGASSSGDLKVTGSAPETDDLAKMRKDAKDAADAIAKTGSPRLLVLGLGWAF